MLVAIFAGVSNINEVVELCNIGTLFAFILVAGGLMILRSREPDRPRPYRVPFHPWVPLGAMITSGWLMLQLPGITWLRFILWLAVGLVIYAAYGLRRAHRQDGPTQ